MQVPWGMHEKLASFTDYPTVSQKSCRTLIRSCILSTE